MYNNVRITYTNVRWHDKNYKFTWTTKNNTHMLFNKMYADIMINIIYRMRQFMTTYISYTQIYVDMIKNIKSPEQPIMTAHILFNRMYADMMINIIYQMIQFIYARTYIFQKCMLTVKWWQSLFSINIWKAHKQWW